MPPIRVVLGEDNYLVREGIVRLIDLRDELELVASCGDVDALLAVIEAERPDVVITDVRMPPSFTDEGIRVAERLRREHPATGVVILSQYDDPDYAVTLFEGGSERRAYLLKERMYDVGQLVHAVSEVHHGGSVIDPKIVESLVAARTRSARSPLSRLTPRETEILTEMATGKNNAAICSTLVLSDRALEKHINAIFSKLGLSEEPDVHRRVKAVLLFLSARGAPGVAER